MIDITRPDKITHDIFDVDSSGKGWHTVIQVGGATEHVLFNDALPSPLSGSWSQFLMAEWSANYQQLLVYGRGSQNGISHTYYMVWDGDWQVPVKQP